MMALERRTGYKPNHVDFGKFLLSEQARDPAVEAAHNIVTLVGIRAPRSTSKLAESYKVNEDSAPITIAGNPRVGAEVYSDDPAAAPQEFGNARVRNPSRPLGKAGAELGEMAGEPG
jgi:hypothetical protein